MTKDSNLCPYCGGTTRLEIHLCTHCSRPIVLPADGAISIWRLGEIRPGLIERLAEVVSRCLSVRVVVQPALLDARPSERPSWSGNSANVLLRQTLNRAQNREVAALTITERNIVPSSSYNFLFGYAYLGLPAAAVSVHPLAQDSPPEELLVARLAKIALHELGHTFGLGHHSYSEEEDCVMVGDADLDTLQTVDSSTCGFCKACSAQVARNRRIKLRGVTTSLHQTSPRVQGRPRSAICA